MEKTTVLIAGGGPVGLSLALELGLRNIDVILVEERDGVVTVPKMSQVSARAMEFCRRWGIADEVRGAVWSNTHSLDFVYLESLQGREIARQSVPSYAIRGRPDYSPEGPCHCPQIYFDPILVRRAQNFPTLSLRYNTRLNSFEQDESGVTAHLTNTARGDAHEIRARWLVGCDGPGGVVRSALDIPLDGQGTIANSLNIYFRSPVLQSLHDKGWARFYRIIDASGCWSEMIPIDGDELWRLTVFDQPPGEIDTASILRRAVGSDFPHEILSAQLWDRRDHVAPLYGSGRVFIAGDAAHQCSPTGGLGMHSGIGEAINLAWKLEACAKGWGGPGLLATYQAERQPIARRNVTLATNAFNNITSLPGTAGIDAVFEGDPGPVLRAMSIGEQTKTQYCYENSAICVTEDSEAPSDNSIAFVPSARPGTRAPHVWLADGRSTLDLFGDGFVLLRLGDAAPEVNSIENAFARRGAPLSVIALEEPEILALYQNALVLVRPDGHVAWRSDTPPADANALTALVCGG
jgi:2-polyprenyl-6-methoxyphenol hydroxylase-like FAD-dependent oxidoreductase